MRFSSLLVMILIFGISNVQAQHIRNGSKEDEANLLVVKSAVLFLKSKRQPVKSENAGDQPEDWLVYDSLIYRHYDLPYLRDSISNLDTGFLQRKAQRIFLYNADVLLDILPLDSIVLMREPNISTGSTRQQLIVYSVGYEINDRIGKVAILFFSGPGKILMFTPYIDFDNLNKDVDIFGFYRRHGYDKVKDKLYDF